MKVLTQLIFVLALLFCLYEVKGYEINVNFGGIAEGRFISDQNSLIQLKNNPNLSSKDSAQIKGAQAKNQVALGSHRWLDGNWGATIQTEVNGVFECSLHFAETSIHFSESGKRVFNAKINGNVKYDIDVFNAVGAFQSHTVTFTNIIVNNKEINLSMMQRKGDPFLSAITCVDNSTTPTTPSSELDTFQPTNILINIGGPAVGRFQGENSQQVSIWGSPQENFIESLRIEAAEPQDQQALRTHRWSKKSWGLSISNMAPGNYKCTLYFAESSPFYFEVGKRVFHASVNGNEKKNIDVYKAAEKWTQHVETYKNIPVPWKGENSINVMLTQNKGDPFLSAITCDTPPTVTDPGLLKCSSRVESGGQGFQRYIMDLERTAGTFTLQYDMKGIPDKLVILYEGQEIFTTNGYVSGSNAVVIPYGSPSSTSSKVTIELAAKNPGTSWEFSISCPL